MKSSNSTRLTNSIVNKDLIHRLFELHPDGGRILFHESDSSRLHVMLINFPPNYRYPKHIHFQASEFYYVLKGSLVIDIFDDNYLIQKEIRLDENCGFLLNPGQIHATNSGEKGVSFLEIRNGPFDKNDSKILQA